MLQGYYPGGMQMPGRKYSSPSSSYRYGFNGKENDKDAGEGIQDYGMRIYDSRLGKFLSVDPLTKKYPELTPYQFASNCPISGVDLDGLEFYYTADGKFLGNGPDKANTEIRIVNSYYITQTEVDCLVTIHTIVTDFKTYGANSDKSLLGRNESTPWGGITELTNQDLSLLNDFVSGFVTDIHKNIENAMLTEANAGPMKNSSKLLDFKAQIFTLFDIPYNNLISIDGVIYNPNEAGNYVWGLTTEMAGSFISPNMLGQAGSIVDDFRFDESWDQKAMSAGRAKAYDGSIKSTGLFDKVVDFFKSDYEDFIKSGGESGKYKPSIPGMLKNIRDYKESKTEDIPMDIDY